MELGPQKWPHFWALASEIVSALFPPTEASRSKSARWMEFSAFSSSKEQSRAEVGG